MKIYLLIFGVGGVLAWMVYRSQQATGQLSSGEIQPTTQSHTEVNAPVISVDIWKGFVAPTGTSYPNANGTVTARSIKDGGWSGTPRPVGGVSSGPTCQPGTLQPSGACGTPPVPSKGVQQYNFSPGKV